MISQNNLGKQNIIGNNNVINKRYEVPQSIVEFFTEVIKKKKISDIELELENAIKKYKEIEPRLEKRPDHDEVIAEAKAALKLGNLEKAEEFLLKSYNKNTKYAAEDAFELGSLKELKIEYHEAKKYYEKAVNLAPENSLYLNNFATLLCKLGEYKESITLFEKALLISKQAYGENHQNVATYLNNLGYAWYSLREYQKAVEYVEKALSIDKKVFGENHSNIAIRLHSLGWILYSSGKYDKAIEYLEKALCIDKKAFGENHPCVAKRLTNLGYVYDSLGRYKTAIDLFEKAEKIFLEKFDKDNTYTKSVKGQIESAIKNRAKVTGKAEARLVNDTIILEIENLTYEEQRSHNLRKIFNYALYGIVSEQNQYSGIILDAHKLDTIDEGLTFALVSIGKRFRVSKIVLLNPKEIIKAVWEACHIDKVIPIFYSIKEAQEYFSIK